MILMEIKYLQKPLSDLNNHNKIIINCGGGGIKKYPPPPYYIFCKEKNKYE